METEVCTKIKIKIYNALQKSISCIIIHILHFFLIKLRIKGKYIIQITIYARINAFLTLNIMENMEKFLITRT